MKICIVYDTKRQRGATVHIVQWMLEELKKMSINADAKRVDEVDSFDYDVFIVGLPIYYEKPMKSVVDFLQKNKDKLSSKKVAVFIVCLATSLGKLASWYVKRRYLKPLEKSAGRSLVKSGVFKGWIRKPNYSEKERVVKWIRELISSIYAKN